MRKEINSIVRQYAIKNNNDFEGTWNKLYKFYNKVAHKNIKRRANNKKARPLDVIENIGDLELLKDLAVIALVA